MRMLGLNYLKQIVFIIANSKEAIVGYGRSERTHLRTTKHTHTHTHTHTHPQAYMYTRSKLFPLYIWSSDIS